METELVVILDGLYGVARPWGVLPQGLELAFVSAVAVDARDEVYIAQRVDPPVLVFDASGEYLRSWGSGVIVDAHGIVAAPDGRILVVDRDAHQVLVFDGEGELLLRLGERHRPRLQEPFNHPTGVVVTPDGEVLVADGYANASVHRFSADGRWLQTWGSPGSGPGEFLTPHAVVVDGRGRILVADRDNDRVQVFDAGGAYLDAWTDFFHPMDLYAGRAGMVYVTDQVPRLSMLDAGGRVRGRCRPVPYMPHGVCGDSRGNLYLVESAPIDQITKLVRTGETVDLDSSVAVNCVAGAPHRGS